MNCLRGVLEDAIFAAVRPAAGLLVWLGGAAALAQSFALPSHFQAVPLPGTWNLPVGITFTPDGKIFLLEKPGVVRVLDAAGVAQGAPFLDLTAEVNNDHDRGLLGIALHPGFVPNDGSTSWVYLLYTVSPVPPNDNGYNQDNKYSFGRLTRYKATTSGSSIVADVASRQILIGHQNADGSVPDCFAQLHDSHSSGSLRFADDGSLMVTVGDGAHYDLEDFGGFDDPGFDDWIHPVTGKKGPTPKAQDEGAFRAQDINSLAGKVLRLNPANGNGYPSNPFYNGNVTANRSRVWALGLRNPYRMDLVPGTGSTDVTAGNPNVVILGEVGWNTWEEFNVARIGGENFGWPCYEGFLQQSGYQLYNPAPGVIDCATTPPGILTPPQVSWKHGDAAALTPLAVHQDINGNPGGGYAGNCSIGGPIYTGGTYPATYVGRAFITDYVGSWVKTVTFDSNFNVTAVQDFGSDMGVMVDLERNPVTGDIYGVSLQTSRIYKIRYGDNLAPVAVAQADTIFGSSPLQVQFIGSGSFDPDNDLLTYDWDFGDGSPHSTLADPLHTYTTDSVYTATLVVTDPLLATSQDTVQVAVGNLPPTVSITTPAMGLTYPLPASIPLSGAGDDPEGLPLSYHWQIDLYHATHVHPGAFVFDGPTASFPIDVSPDDNELLYYRVNLTVTDLGGLQASAHVFIYPQKSVFDVAGTALPVSHVFDLSPPTPTGGGNKDIEVIRDNVFAPLDSSDDTLEFDHYHNGDQGNDDWIGYTLPAVPVPSFRFTRLVFQEGKNFIDGGWFNDLRAEVRNGGVWTALPSITITPAYPFQFSELEWFNGHNFDTYTVDFDPVFGDGIRLRGTPGGTKAFISTGELRVQGVQPIPQSAWKNLSAQGSIIAKVDSLSPPGPQGQGSLSKETIRNGTMPPVGSTSFLAQYDTSHAGAQGSDDWIGYDFGQTTTFNRLVYQEGRNDATGGAFTSLNVQIKVTANGSWSNVSGVTSSPPYSGANGVNYETFTLDFPAVNARAIRIQGPPSGTVGYTSVGELSVWGPAAAPGCGWLPYGQNEGGANTLDLSSNTQPTLGANVIIDGSGALPSSAGAFGVSVDSAHFPLKGGTLLVDPVQLVLSPMAWSGAGTLTLAGQLPTTPSLAGVSIYLQVFTYGQPAPFPIRFSNGLQLTFCAP
jgi:glucose/arabinose dehydrogenase